MRIDHNTYLPWFSIGLWSWKQNNVLKFHQIGSNTIIGCKSALDIGFAHSKSCIQPTIRRTLSWLSHFSRLLKIPSKTGSFTWRNWKEVATETQSSLFSSVRECETIVFCLKANPNLFNWREVVQVSIFKLLAISYLQIRVLFPTMSSRVSEFRPEHGWSFWLKSAWRNLRKSFWRSEDLESDQINILKYL